MSYLQKLIKLADVIGEVALHTRISDIYKDSVRGFANHDYRRSKIGKYEFVKIKGFLELCYQESCFSIYTIEAYKRVLRYTSSSVKGAIIEPAFIFEDEEQGKEDMAEIILRFGAYREFQNFSHMPPHIKSRITQSHIKTTHDVLKDNGIEFIYNSNLLSDDEMIVKDILE